MVESTDDRQTYRTIDRVRAVDQIVGDLRERILRGDLADGERLAGERLRRVEAAVHEPENAITLRQLRELVLALADRATGPEPA